MRLRASDQPRSRAGTRPSRGQIRATRPPEPIYGWSASRTIVLMLRMFSARSGHVMSVDTHCARVIPQPQGHRARFAAWSALLLSLDVSSEKLTTAMSASEYATPEVREMPHTSRATPAATPSHVRIRDKDRAGFLRPAFLPEARLMRLHGSTTRHSR